MGKTRYRISGIGCALADFLYYGIDFSAEGFTRYLSKSAGDGGLNPGKLVFTEELEKFAGKAYPEILNEITGGKSFDAVNTGGPGLVSLINAAQLLDGNDFHVRFYGNLGMDNTADLIASRIALTPLDAGNFIKRSSRPSPFTDVLSDPDFDNGNGERTFVNNIGAAWDFTPDLIPDEFFQSDMICFGGTALVPVIHDNLTMLLEKSKLKECITVVNTVFDFRNERRYPGKPWPLVNNKDDMKLIDILIMDNEEALRISGTGTSDEATEYFSGSGTSSFIITNGARDITAFSDGTFFRERGTFKYPVSSMVNDGKLPKGDTTGCGDNFAGGIIASVAFQKCMTPNMNPELHKAMILAVASGAFACSYLGGTYYESRRYEKQELIKRIAEEYAIHIGRNG
jgi:sugar/nucleoside kinase (ribokinase family)